MTQPLSQAAQAHLNAGSVVLFLAPIQQRENSILQNFDACKEAILEAAELYAEEKDEDKLNKLRDQLLHLVELEHKVNAHKAAVMRVGQQYQPSLEKSEFAGLIQTEVQQSAASVHPERDDHVKEFDQIAGLETAAAQEPGDDDDDDVIVDAGVQKNDRCPITMKLLIDLKDPVEDDKGFVYEGEAIRQTITRSGGWMECPVAGASHRVQLSTLKPCRRVIRMQKQRQRQGTQAQAGHGGQRGMVLDV
eukprot:GHUV01007071.1.p1 GENE.GHUV01007071.1~~GHUV01007071.1.p1  ORF type:complete len:248 (+),score=71.52 GHUV01007071.1:273-1016(+)